MKTIGPPKGKNTCDLSLRVGRSVQEKMRQLTPRKVRSRVPSNTFHRVQRGEDVLLSSLERVAQAMGCRVDVAIVPMEASL
jgi:hypothetical protein